MLPSRVPSYTSGRQKRTVHVFSEIFKQRFLKIIRTPHFFAVLSSTLVHFGTLKTHGCTHSQKYLELRFLKITRTPHAFIVLSSTIVKCVLGDSENCGNLHLAEKQLSSQTEQKERTPQKMEEKTLGVLGGVGPLATIYFADLVV